jgi:hypothetical protein
VVGIESGLPFISFLYPNIVETPSDIKLDKITSTLEFID